MTISLAYQRLWYVEFPATMDAAVLAHATSVPIDEDDTDLSYEDDTDLS